MRPDNDTRGSASAISMLAVVSLLGAITTERASACATAFSRGERPPRTASEEALIVWDEATNTEHFIRRARFEGAPAHFGFLVPTPARPELAEADQNVFTRLSRLFSRPHSSGGGGGSTGRSSQPPPMRARPVTIVEERDVAGMHATVLSATDARALSTWLGENGFESRPALTAWLTPYVRRHFFVTAFRYDARAQETRVSTQAVRLSFRTRVPFYPYAEPSDAPRESGRRFLLSVVSTTRVAGRLEARPWEARTGFAAPLADAATTLAGVVPDPAHFAGAWLTTFEEPSSTRGRHDLSFVRARETSRVPPSISYY